MVRQFCDIRVGDVSIVGGKGANLGEMVYAGINVPEGFVVTSDAYRLFLKENNLVDAFERILSEAGDDEAKLSQAAEKLRKLIKSADMPECIMKAVRDLYEKLGNNVRVAVRSSATAEDLPDASFAGQQETYLNVIGIEAVIDKIRDCYASLWGNRAVIYRNNQGYDQKSVALAVVIQKMVESEIAGVLFTVNPINGNENEMQINASYGLGESVVSGRVTADSFVCGKDGKVINTVIGEKATEIIYSENSGTVELPVDENRRKISSLDDELLKELCLAGANVEKYYNMPMDIEWGIVNRKIYILQARAITTLKKNDYATDDAAIQKYLKNCKCTGAQKTNMSFLLEKMPFVFLPYDYELIEIIDDQKSVIFSEAGIIMDMQPIIDDDGVMILPPNGVKLSKNIIHFPALFKKLLNMKNCEEILRKEMKMFHKELDDIKRKDYDSMSLAECAKMNEYFKDYIRRLTYSRFKYALFPSAIFSKKIGGVLKKVNKKLTAFDLYQELDYETALMTRDIERIASSFSKKEEIVGAIQSGMGYEKLCDRYEDAKIELQQFMDKHGYKSDYNCYCITAKAFYEDPDRLINLLRPLVGKKECKSENAYGYENILNGIKENVSENKYKKLLEEIESYRYMHVIREESQLMWETAFYYVKKLLSHMSLELTGDKDYMKSLAYLFTSELTEVAERGKLLDSDIEKIERRKRMRPLAEKVWEGAKLKVFDDTGDELKGVSGSAGEATGRVCIISGPEEFYKFNKGDILVCRLTDPEWTPLFSLAKAVVADTGAELSHAAIVAREYGIPAVLGVGLATMKYKDGDMIRVDGSKGIVSKIG